MKPYHDPAEQIETEDIPPKESYKGPITRSRIKTLEQNDSGALAVGSLVVRASDSRPEGLGSMLRCHQIPSECTRSTCSLNQWVSSLVGLFTSAGTGEYFPPLQFTCRNCGGGDRGRVAIYRPFREFHRAQIALSPVWCSRSTTGVPLVHATMHFVGLVLTTSDRWN
ncbi:hypothetical protein TNCV_978881 [Trichonephila clavipes]|nr:hypothetical protein TNCV_978881 [Trichonephila clavipes]